MKSFLSRLVRFSALFVATIAAGCGDGAPSLGGERQACYPNGSCNPGLTCVTNSKVCVDLGGTGGTGGRGGGGGAQAGSSGGSVAGSGGSGGGGGSGAGGTTGTGGSSAGTGGTTGTGGSAGTGGTTGTGGGSAGAGGTTGTGGGAAGTGGGAAGRGGAGGGTAGSAGGSAGTTGTAGTGGSAGMAGTGGSAGMAGTGGSAGMAGTGGSSGSAGTGGTSPCLVPANYGTVGRATTPAARMPSMDIKWRLPLEAGTPADQLHLDLFYNYGVFKPGVVKTGTYTLAGDELSNRWCGLCVLIDEGASGSTVRGSYMATGGSVTLTSVAGKLTGQLTNVTFQHVNIDPDTLVNTPHPDGCTSAIGTLIFDVDITN